MAIFLPSVLIPNSQKHLYLYAGKVVRGVTQAGQKAVYPNSLHGVSVNFPPKAGTDIDEIKCLLAEIGGDEILYPIQQPELGTIPTMSTTLSGIASGSTLPVAGLSSSYAMRKGQYLSVVDSGNGRRYVYQLKTASASGSTSRNLTISGTVRRAHPSGSVVEITQPYLQGELDGREMDLDINVHANIAFTVSELR